MHLRSKKRTQAPRFFSCVQRCVPDVATIIRTLRSFTACGHRPQNHLHIRPSQRRAPGAFSGGFGWRGSGESSLVFVAPTSRIQYRQQHEWQNYSSGSEENFHGDSVPVQALHRMIATFTGRPAEIEQASIL
ncbi:hypothetical protein DEDE109153_02220 [Deinococcus deserti]